MFQEKTWKFLKPIDFRIILEYFGGIGLPHAIGDPIGKSWTNLISGKSQYMDFTRLGINLFSIKLHNIMKIRTPVYNDIVDSIKNDTLIKKETQNQLIKDNVVLLIKKENIKSFPKNIYKKTLNSSDVLVLFLDKQKIDRFNTTCTSKF